MDPIDRKKLTSFTGLIAKRSQMLNKLIWNILMLTYYISKNIIIINLWSQFLIPSLIDIMFIR